MRLIDADKINFKWINGVICVEQKDIRKASTVDAVPVIRCKDCRFSVDEYGDGECYCRTDRELLRYIGDWHHYCGWGEKK